MDRRTGRFDHRIHTPGSSFRIYFIQLEQDHLSDSVGRSAFRIFRRWPSVLSMAGPLCLVMVILCWVLMIAIGFALIYLGRLAGQLQIERPRNPHSPSILVDVLLLSGGNDDAWSRRSDSNNGLASDSGHR